MLTNVPWSIFWPMWRTMGLHGLLKKPNKLSQVLPNKTNRDKYCRFHKDHEHDILDCIDLKEQIESLIEMGYWKKYVSQDEQCASIKTTKDQERERLRFPSRCNIDRPTVINMVHSGQSGGQSRSMRKVVRSKARGIYLRYQPSPLSSTTKTWRVSICRTMMLWSLLHVSTMSKSNVY